VGVPPGSPFHVHTGQVGQGHQPGQDVRELLLAGLGLIAPQGSGQLAHLLDEPPEGAVHPPGPVPLEVGIPHEALELGEMHGVESRGQTGRGLSDQPRMYGDLASWFHLITAPEEYTEEAERYRRLMVESAERPVKDVLELGSGGGNNASHLKEHFAMTLVDLSPGMLEVSRGINPECEHMVGDMRSVRLGRTFDAVFLHDALDYLTTEDDLRATTETAAVHCAPGGVALFVPDHVRETFRTRTDHGGNDGPDRAARYLEWTWDPDPSDTTYFADYVYLLRDRDGILRTEQDRHVCGLFGRETWLRLLREAAFEPRIDTSGTEEPGGEAFVALKRS
jgi:SAM-dependent methyltransferase